MNLNISLLRFNSKLKIKKKLRFNILTDFWGPNRLGEAENVHDKQSFCFVVDQGHSNCYRGLLQCSFRYVNYLADYLTIIATFVFLAKTINFVTYNKKVCNPKGLIIAQCLQERMNKVNGALFYASS